MAAKREKRAFFFSLVWKAILSVSFATFLASGAIVLFGKFTLDRNYQQERTRVHNFYQQAFKGILKRIKSDRVDIGWLIPSFLDTSIPNDKALNAIKELIEANWFKIELQSDIESAFLFTKEGQLVGEWGNTLYQGQFSEWLEYVAKNESTFDNILCEESCIHFHASPFLHNGNFIGIFIFGIDLADTVLQMKNITGSNVGILTQKMDASGDQVDERVMPWSFRIIALTEFEKNMALLKAFSKQNPVVLDQEAKLFKFKDKHYELIPLPFNGNNQTILLVIEDISKAMADIEKATALYAINGLLSLLLSGGVLLILLIRPTQKLKNLITLLPLIARKQYDLVFNSLFKTKKRGKFKDEIDVLESAAHELINTLKKLDDEVNQRTQRLSDQALELQFEKNFIDNILNSAQVIIMTIDSKEQIKSVNKYAEYLTGYRECALIGKKFADLIHDEDRRKTIRSSIIHLINTRKKTLQYECPIYSLNGSELYISWFLSPLVIEDMDYHPDPEILIVGLDLTDRRKYENQLTWLAEHDPLTSLYNRRKFERELEQAITVATRYDHISAIIFFDIDQFKYVNDSSGHQVGDELLIKVAEKLRAATRKTDVVARFGGDEFIVLAPNISQAHAESLVQKICNDMSTVVIADGNERHRVTVSAGLLMFPEQNCTAQDLLATADVAMYRAKEAGRGGWRLASREDINRHEIKNRVNWKAKIEKALEDERFKLYYQPIMRISDNNISHYECLLRMTDVSGEIVPPGMFIEIAEHTGLIFQLDQRVIELAFKQQAELLKKGFDVKLSINLSGEMLSNPDAFNIISRLLENYQLDAHHFIFEVTETQAVTNLQAAHDFITQINGIGGSFALDDFGVGFSSMNYLKQLPVSYLKIDGSFVKNIAESHEDQLFVNAINSVGHGMEIKTIAEFVENESILEILADLGVDYAQGYGVGKPMAYPEFHIDKNRDDSEFIDL
ncbi:MAG: EAL domain-containing protein [Gammaproteobacteria bacterium]